MKIISNSPSETLKLGLKWGKSLRAGDIIALVGELGAGKTCLTQGLLEGLGINTDYKGRSSTFVLMNEYEGRVPIYHFDIYRLNNTHEILDLGFEEYVYGNGVAIIEWADRLEELYPKNAITIKMDITGIDIREIELITKNGERFK